MVVPRLESIAERLRAARHEALVDDSLAADPPAVRFEFRPWIGPWHPRDPTTGVLEVELSRDPESEEIVVVRQTIGETYTEVAYMPVRHLTGSMIDARALGFLGDVLRSS